MVVTELKQFLLSLHRSGVDIYVENGKLMTKSAPGVISQEIGRQIRDNRHALLALLQSTTGNDARPYGDIVPVSRTAPLPLSFAQQRLWFIDQLGGGSTQYNMPTALALDGWLDRYSLRATLDEIVRRHEVLRTTYASVNGQGEQRVGPALPVPLPITDLSTLAGAAQDAEVRRIAAAEAGRPFDLAHDLMLRAHLLFLGPQRHVLLVTLHHIASDGWSMGVVVNEFGTLYEAFSAGRRSPLPEISVQYADYAHWQRTSWQPDRLERQLAYWQRQLADLPQAHSLPLDHPRPARQQFEGRLHTQVIDAALLERLKALAGTHQATLFMVLQSAFALLLARWSNETDIVMGSPIAGRNHREVDGLVGLFVNTLVLRSRLRMEAGFGALLEEGRAMLLDAYAHQDLPFEQLVDALKPERSQAHAPLFQIMFSLQNTEQGSLRLADLQIGGIGDGRVITKFDLELSAVESGGTLRLVWNGAASLFDAETIARMADSFGVLLDAIVGAPQAPLGTLALLTESDRRKLAAWRSSPVPYPQDACIHELFEAQAARTPDAVAAVCGEEAMTYLELNRQANRIAHRLRAQGVVEGTLVGLCLRRSNMMIAAMLGILKAGGAYVPLDPAYPRERLEFMLQDSALGIVLTSAALRHALPAHRETVLCLDDADLLAGQPQDNPVSCAGAGSLAYVIYTSGSTGMPKGVMVEHRGVARLALPSDYVPYNSETVMLHLSSVSFDAATFEVWGPLLHGGKVVVYPHMVLDVEGINELMTRHGVTTMFLTSGMFDLWSSHLPGAGTLRWVMTGGDVVPPGAAARLYAAMGGVQMVALYGPTENTSVTTFFPVPRDWPDTRALPIGSPIAGTTIDVLDPCGVPAPVGVAGELYVGGAGLARGYLGRPDLNAAMFAGSGARRRYRTGDQARFRADGSLEFLGRRDGQVKLRGFRIEVEEIEAHLVRSGIVTEACVLLHGEGKDKRLAAYVAGGSRHQDLAGALRAALRQTMPEYMVPSVFVSVATLPLTTSGKVDRRRLLALPLAAAAPEDATDTGAAPCGAAARIAVVWCVLLGMPEIGIDTPFFEAGGNSITLIELRYRLQEAGFEFSLKELMEQPTVRGLAALLDDATRHTSAAALKAVVRLNEAKTGQPLYILHPFGGGVEGYRVLARGLEATCPVFGLQAPFMFGLDFPFSELSELARFYADAIMAHSALQVHSLAGYSGGGKLAAQVARILIERGHEVNYVALFDANIVDPDRTDDEDDYTRLCRFCYSLNVINSAAEVPQEWRQAGYADQLEHFAGLVLKKRSYARDEVVVTLKFGVNLLRAGCTDPSGLRIAGAVASFVSSGNQADADNRSGWSRVFENDVDFRTVSATHDNFMEPAAVHQMLAPMAAGLALRATPTVLATH
ncbi:amino acid adenylation domain-containing protein [Massilia forsythiae]|uniref:Amino acid adenylation domain-containing protein n=1 Tax=Massilia forsythiae TaxID=2728020 RepID=A0A7Z2VYM0_9BURK|nr:non-ribosomal peptide synthetase [Massilia forsythiae]QJE01529.1 amino acid adenylation domain-containing protein [Massilia forsythiae]